MSLLDFLRVMLTENWNKILNNEKEYNFNKFEDYYIGENYKIFSENFIKLLDFIENNFSEIEQKKFVENFLSVSFLSTLNFNEYYKTSIFCKIILICLKNNLLNFSIFQLFVSNCYYYKNFNLIMETMEILKVDREFIRTILFDEKFIEKMRKLIAKGHLNEYESDKKITNDLKLGTFEFFTKYFQKYKNSDEEVQEIFISWKNIVFTFIDFPENFHLVFIEKVKEIFHTNQLKILECIDMKSIIPDLNYILIFEKFVVHYFNNNEDQVVKTMNKILFRAYYYPFYNNFPKLSLDDYKKFLNLFTKYKISQENLIRIVKEWEIFPKFFQSFLPDKCQMFKEFLKININSNKSQINECIKKFQYSAHNIIEIITNEEKFNNLEDFLTDFFDGDKNEIKICIRNILVSFYYYQCIVNAVHAEDSINFERIKMIFMKYLTIDELQNEFLTQPFFENMFRLKESKNFLNFDNFLAFAKEIFGENRQKIMEYDEPGEIIGIISSEVAFNSFEQFLLEFFENDESQVRKFMRLRLLDNSERGCYAFSYSCFFNEYCGKNLRIIFKKYTSSSEIQNLLISWKNIIEIFARLSYISTIELWKFLLETFGSNKIKVLECIDNSQLNQFEKNLCALFTFEQFLITLFHDDENQVKNCMRKILFRNFRPSLLFDIAKDLGELELLTDFYLKYKHSDKMLQNFIAKIDIFSEIFKHLTKITYPIFKEFIFKAFGSNKKFLRKIFKLFEIVNLNQDYFYQDFYSREFFHGHSSDRDIKRFVKDFDASIYEN